MCVNFVEMYIECIRAYQWYLHHHKTAMVFSVNTMLFEVAKEIAKQRLQTKASHVPKTGQTFAFFYLNSGVIIQYCFWDVLFQEHFNAKGNKTK